MGRKGEARDEELAMSDTRLSVANHRGILERIISVIAILSNSVSFEAAIGSAIS
jgi:hypothetical protein